MPFDNTAYSAEWHKRNPGKRHEYYLKTHPGSKTLDALKAESRARTEKICSKCELTKPFAEFSKSSRNLDGMGSECLPCLRTRTAKHHAIQRAKREAENPKEILPEGCIRCRRCAGVKGRELFAPNSRICRQCDCDYAKAAYHRNPSKSYEHHRQWCKDHPEEIKELRRSAYRRANPECKTIEEVKAEKDAKALLTEKPCKKCEVVKPIDGFGLSKKTADGRQYQCRTCMAERGRQHYAVTPKMLENAKRWSKANPEKTRHVAQVRRARKLSVPGTHTLAQWREMCARFDQRCVCCGVAGKLTRDHIVPISDPNSSHDISNIQPLCFSCNSSKNNRYAVDYRTTPFTRSGQNVMFG